MRRLGLSTAALLVALGIAGGWLSRPQPVPTSGLPEHTPDAVAGERLFWAGGCASCHASSADGQRAKDGDKLRLGGGLELDTPFGLFRVPNISSHPRDGIGDWSMIEFVNAMQRGVSPSGKHYYPSFPYASYARMPVQDVMDLRAFLATLDAVEGRPADHELGFPWSIRRGVGLWKLRNLDPDPVVATKHTDARFERGRLLVEGVGHCGECHTPRDAFGGTDPSRWLGGADNLDGAGRIPNITTGGKTIASWSEGDIAYYLESGFTPDFDTVGGSMVAVQENLAHLPAEDRQAIAAYLKAIPPVETVREP